MAFLYAPDRWIRRLKASWTDQLEKLRASLLLALYRQAGAPHRLPDGSPGKGIAPEQILSPRSPKVTSELAHTGTLRLAQSGVRFISLGETREGEALALTGFSYARHLLASLETHHDDLSEAIRVVHKQLEKAMSGRARWKICRICARVFPARRKIKSCPPCRRRLSRRQVQWRLKSAPKVPLEILSVGMSSRRWIRFSLGRGLDAPASLRRLAQEREGD